MARPMIETVSYRYEFSLEERADLGRDLAKTRQDKVKIDEEENSQKAKIRERRSELELRDGALCRMISESFEMRQVDCTLRWDDPNVGEVSYYRQDTGALLKTRAMTVSERQLELPLQTEEQTKNNVVSFFQKGGEIVEGGKDAAAGGDGPEPPPEAEKPQGEAVAEPESAVVEPPADFQGSLEEYQKLNKPAPPLPSRGRRPKKTSEENQLTPDAG